MIETKTTSKTMPKTMTLPSDQEASGRMLGAEELDALAEAIRSGTLTSTKGNVRQDAGKAVRRAGWDGFRLRLLLRHRGHPYGRGRDRSRAGRRDRHHADHRHGGDHPNPLPGGDPGLRRRSIRPPTTSPPRPSSRCFSDRTRAIIVTHLFGNPCRMGPILELARRRGIPVIEDCARRSGPAGTTNRWARWGGSAASASSRANTSLPARAGWSSPTIRSWPGGCSCSSTRPGATATPSRTITSWR